VVDAAVAQASSLPQAAIGPQAGCLRYKVVKRPDKCRKEYWYVPPGWTAPVPVSPLMATSELLPGAPMVYETYSFFSSPWPRAGAHSSTGSSAAAARTIHRALRGAGRAGRPEPRPGVWPRCSFAALLRGKAFGAHRFASKSFAALLRGKAFGAHRFASKSFAALLRSKRAEGPAGGVSSGGEEPGRPAPDL
jgi:hypothetical protein